MVAIERYHEALAWFAGATGTFSTLAGLIKGSFRSP